jgi:hypothetical protein
LVAEDTSVPTLSQWADTHTIARGTGRSAAAFIHALLNSLSSMAFIGLPCPMNKIGIRSVND